MQGPILNLVAVAPDDTVLEAANQMLTAGVRHLPVQEGELVAGVVSARNVLDDADPRQRLDRLGMT